MRGAFKDVPSFTGAQFVNPYNPNVFNCGLESFKFGNHEADSAFEFRSLGPYDKSTPSSGSTINPSSIISHGIPTTSGTGVTDGQTLDDRFPFEDFDIELSDWFPKMSNWSSSGADVTAGFNPGLDHSTIVLHGQGNFMADLDTTSEGTSLLPNQTWRDSFMPPPATVYSTGNLSSATKDTTPPQRYKCYSPGCDLSFTRKADKIRHERVHNPAPPVHFCKVDGCLKSGGMGYLRKDKLTEHMRRKHPDLDIKKNSSVDDEFLEEELSLVDYDSNIPALNEVAVKK
jgi:hypothetical protein